MLARFDSAITVRPALVGVLVLLAATNLSTASGKEPSLETQSDKFSVDLIRGADDIALDQSGGGLILSVRSSSGIGRATVSRKIAGWPMVVKIRLHLKGLESFQISAGKRGVGVSVSSGDPESIREHLMPDGREGAQLAKDNPLWVKVKVVADNDKIPLKSGYFELDLPQELFRDNPTQISLHWIDFYRR